MGRGGFSACQGGVGAYSGGNQTTPKNISRATFLKSSAAALTTLALPRWVWAKPEGASSDIRVAVVGLSEQV
jgi:hypothetical protein